MESQRKILKQIEDTENCDIIDELVSEFYKLEDINRLGVGLLKMDNGMTLARYLSLKKCKESLSYILRSSGPNRDLVWNEIKSASIQIQSLMDIAKKIYDNEGNQREFCDNMLKTIRDSPINNAIPDLAYNLARTLMPDGRELIHQAVVSNCFDVLNLLFEKMGDKNKKLLLHTQMSGKYDNLLNISIIFNYDEKKAINMVKFLLEAGADPNNFGNHSPLEIASNHEWIDVLKLLFKHGADPNILIPGFKRGETVTIWQLVQEYGSVPNDIRKLFIANGAK